MVLPSKSPRSLRSSLRSPFASPKSNEQEQDMPLKSIVTKPLAPLSPFRLTPRARRNPIATTPMALLSPIRQTSRKAVRRPAFSIPYDPENESTTTSVTYRSGSSEDIRVWGVDAQGSVVEPVLSKAGKWQEISPAHCPSTSLPSTSRVSLREFLEKPDRKSGSKRATRLRAISRQKVSSTGTIPLLGPADLAGLPLVADLDVSIAETLFSELMKSKTPPKKGTMKTRTEIGPVFAQLRCSEGEAYVEYVRPDGLSEIFSPVSELTRKHGFVGPHKGWGSAA